MTAPTLIPFNIIDEGYAHADDPVEPLTVQIEVRAVESLDSERLGAAVTTALGLHPLARARMAPWVDDETGYRWLVDTEPQVNPFRSVAAVASELDNVRAAFYSQPLSLFESPPLRVQHVRVDGGDVVMLSVHHAAADGVGSLRLLRSICRAYAGLDDPRPAIDAADARALAVPTTPPSLSDQLHSGQMEMQRLAQLGSFPARLAPLEQEGRSGYGFKTLSVALGPIVESPLRRELGASVNDVLIAASSLAAGRWNREHGADASRVVVLMPMNARPAQWSRDVVANLVVADSVSTSLVERRDPRSCLQAVAAWTAAVKQRGPGPALAALASIPRSGSQQRRSFSSWVKQGGMPMAETLVLSNLGRIPDGELGIELQDVNFSPPGTMPFGLGLGAVTLGDQLQLTLRHRWNLWSSSACGEFADVLLEELAELTVR